MNIWGSSKIKMERARRRLQKPALFVVGAPRPLGFCLSYYYKPHDAVIRIHLMPAEHRPGYRR